MESILLQALENIWSELPELLGEGWSQLEKELTALKKYITVKTTKKQVTSDEIERLDKEIESFQQQLQIYTRNTAPEQWAEIMISLANAYRDRNIGDYWADNIEQSLTAYRQALEIYKIKTMPLEWARIMMNMALAYKLRVRGDTAENIKQSAEMFQNGEKIIRIKVFHIFSNYKKAYSRLVEVINKFDKQNDSTRQTRNIGSRGKIENGDSRESRFTDISCPKRVWINTPRISLIVRLRVQKHKESSATTELKVLPGALIKMRVESTAFDALNEPEQEAIIRPNSDSLPVVFDLCPKQIGQASININFLEAGNPLGTVSIPIEVTEHRTQESEEERHEQAISPSLNVKPPKFVLYITYERLHLVFTLIKEGNVGRTFPPVVLQQDLVTYMNRLYERIETVSSRQHPTSNSPFESRVKQESYYDSRNVILLGKAGSNPSDIDHCIKNLGRNLWKDLIPNELKEIYSKGQEEWCNSSLMIVSDEPTVPWELVWPYYQGLKDGNDNPWCLTLQLSRWLRRDHRGNGNDTAAPGFQLKNMAILAPSNSGLSGAAEEHTFLKDFCQKNNITDVSPSRVSLSEVTNLLEEVNYDWLHVAGHGKFSAESPESDSVLWLEDNNVLAPDSIIGTNLESHIKEKRPVFIFNACQVGRQGWGITRLGGWANRLISTGAGMFLAPLWSVDDKSALLFITTFYNCLKKKDTVAEAVCKARQTVKKAGDPTWMAYSLYAHPNAKLV